MDHPLKPVAASTVYLCDTVALCHRATREQCQGHRIAQPQRVKGTGELPVDIRQPSVLAADHRLTTRKTGSIADVRVAECVQIFEHQPSHEVGLHSAVHRVAKCGSENQAYARWRNYFHCARKRHFKRQDLNREHDKCPCVSPRSWAQRRRW